MTAHYLRVINNQLINRSILLDKIDESQGNTEGYASKAKQKLYVPYRNPVNPAVKGYVDLVPTDNVILQSQQPGGVITKMAFYNLVSTATVTGTSIATPVVTAAVHDSPLASELTITGTTFISVYPDTTYIQLTNLAGVVQTISETQLLINQINDLISLTNQIKGFFNNHAASLVFHTIADGLNAPVATANATSLATAIVLLNVLRTAYEAHRVLVGLGPVHTGADAANALAAAAATNLATALVLSEDLKAKFNLHIAVTPAVHIAADAVNTVLLLNGDSFSNTSIKLTTITGGPTAPGWKVRVLANSKRSNLYTVT